MSNSANTNNEAKVELVNETPVIFKQSAGTEYLTRTELCDLINGIFGGIFQDYYGVKLDVNQYGVIEVELAFQHKNDLPDDAVQATCKIGTKDSNSNKIITAINNMAATSFNRKRFDLTETAKLALAKLMIPENAFYNDNGNIYAANSKISTKVGGIHWNARYTFYDVPNDNQIVKITGFSIDAIMGLIHGTEIDGHAVQYRVSYERPIGYYYGNPVSSQNCLFRIEQADVNEIAELATKVNNVIPTIYNPIGDIIRK